MTGERGKEDSGGIGRKGGRPPFSKFLDPPPSMTHFTGKITNRHFQAS